MSSGDPILSVEGARPAAAPGRFAHHVAQLVSGAAATQALAFVLAPIISRLFSPDSFGAAATFAAVLTILTTIVTLRYELAILLPESDRAAASVALGTLLVVALLSALLYLAILLAPNGAALRALVPSPELLPLGMLLGGITLVLIHWGIRQGKFGLLAANRVVSASVAEAGRLAFGLAGRDLASSLIVANIVGVAMGVLVLVRGMRSHAALVARARLSEVGKSLRHYVKFPLYASWMAVLNSVSHEIAPLVLGAFFAPQIVGFYAQANRVAMTPLLVLGGAVTQVFAQGAARARREGNLSALATTTTRNMLRLAWYPAMALLCLGPELTGWFLGTAWTQAGYYARILSLWMLVTLVSNPLATLYAILERQELGLALSIGLLLLRAGGLLVGGLQGDPVLALALFAAAGALLDLAQTVLLMRLAGGRWKPVLKTALLCLAFTAPLLLLTAARPWLGAGPGIAAAIALAGGMCYGGLWLAADRALRVLARDAVHRLWAPKGSRSG